MALLGVLESFVQTPIGPPNHSRSPLSRAARYTEGERRRASVLREACPGKVCGVRGGSVVRGSPEIIHFLARAGLRPAFGSPVAGGARSSFDGGPRISVKTGFKASAQIW